MATFGLIHRDKNFDLVLRAMHRVVQDVPHLLYLIIGETHPAIQLQEGETYLNNIKKNVTSLGLTSNVCFVNKYLDDTQLLRYLRASDIYITPYVNEEQYVSGTLSWAVGVGMAVISTPYVYAKELLADGRGFLFPFSDDKALALIIKRLAEDEGLLNETRHRAYQYGRRMIWPSVVRVLEQVFRDTLLDS